ncbi:DUF3566 domain-containing protein [Streptomyces sp. B3I8]|uniref:DUF3566 domain-containing protein n=1 Tax=Streptomyces sp. B3I8 TaxID=3042303 RepID=UPI002789C41D|nr:DUF3566 domain-containing protein [Streptomyces sp. B3I8]MDQ0788059.1 hypothetical protein [Streptomyces sp. B3I8]
MSGATGAGSTGTPTGTETDGGGRGSAADAADSHETHGPQGGTVTETRGPGTQPYATGGGRAGQSGAAGAGVGAAGKGKGAGRSAGAGGSVEQPAPGSPLPGERQPQQGADGPYHPPQAYQTPPAGAVRRPRTGASTTPRTRKARLRVSRADPWSVMKVSFLLSIALGVCTIVASAVLWMVMDAMGVFSTVGGTISEATGSNESNGFDLQAYLSLPHVLLFAAIIAVIDVVLATALATLGAFIYNLSAGFVGGIELTLAEDE